MCLLQSFRLQLFISYGVTVFLGYSHGFWKRSETIRKWTFTSDYGGSWRQLLYWFSLWTGKNSAVSQPLSFCFNMWLVMTRLFYNLQFQIILAQNRLCGLVGKSVGLSFSWSCCAGGRRFESRPWHYRWGSFSSNQATGKVFSAESIVNSKFILN